MGGGERDQIPRTTAAARRGEPLIHGPPSFSHHSLGSLSFPITPCCFAPPLAAPCKHPYVFHQATFVSLLAPRGSFLPRLIQPDLRRHLPASSCALCLHFLGLNVPLSSLPHVAGLWGRRLPVHHQGDDHPHGELQLPCLWIRRPLSDTCAAGEWSVVAPFSYLQRPKKFTSHSPVCATLLCHRPRKFDSHIVRLKDENEMSRNRK